MIGGTTTHMATLVGHSPREPTDRTPVFVLLALCAAALGALMFAPGDIAAKTYYFLHGVCAQRPSHSFALGGTPLPLDARMTGIYTGAATMSVWLLGIGRLRAMRTPPRTVMVLLGGCIIALAADGFNALLFDLGRWHPYEPSNILRLVTGTLGGLTLGAAVSHVFAASVWRAGDPHVAVVSRPIELLAPLGIALAITAPATSGMGVLYTPYAVGLAAAVIGIFWLIGTAVLALVLGRGWTFQRYRELVPLAAAALAAAIANIGGLALLRFVAERSLELPQLT